MELNINELDKIVEIWLTNEEKQDETKKAVLKPIFALYKKQKYIVSVYESGRGDLQDNTTSLLLYNKNLLA